MGSIDTTNAQELHEQYQPIGELLAVASDITQKNSALEQLIGNGPVTAAADPTIADVVAALTDAANGPSTEVANGRVPMPQNVGIMPPYDETSAGQNYNHLVEMSSIVSLYTAIWNANARTKRGHPEPYNITVADEAAQAFADMANSAYNVMVGPLAGFFNFSSGTQTTFSKKMTKTDVHLEFLGELFKGFSLTKPALLQLDGILTNFVKSLGTVSVETGRTSNTVDQTIRINQVVRLNVSGDDSNPIWVFQPRARIVYMHIDASTWRWATKKADHSENTFNMRYVVVDCDLNVNKYLASKPKLEKVFQTIVNKSLQEYGKMINPSPVDPNAQ
ncbi:hypothetical protein GT037_008832 [Alternaria burnsii]|uniref:Uncharacterized protein n=1 Tax=Alternaria burnsii TaxID=1187904 RepID=A0A8H7ECS5_9PLEO|nr:uncharacterized protein GT037_008832 [Alternaria burnsii]KAF7672881.1 hypothetical protein GT037_008832 [Alternaria burnsii]CAI9635664.1 unnamed protein product [Alternaria burnsii]